MTGERTVLRDARGVREIDYGTVWVCHCCAATHANGECCDGDIYRCDREPWAEVDDRFHVTAGLTSEEHAPECEVALTGEWPVDYECDCERREFSWSSCDGCGSGLGGSRYAHTLWRVRRSFRSGLTSGG